MRHRTIYPAGLCVGCNEPTDRMPLCASCCYVWENDSDTWDAKDAQSQAIRERANAWKAAYRTGLKRDEAALHIGATYKPGHSSDFPF